MSSRPKVLFGLLGLGLTVSVLGIASPPPVQANPGGTALVISEVYGAGGSASATYTHDFIELYNPSGSSISLNGKSLQYRAAATTSAATNVFALPNASVGPGEHYLVRCASGVNGAPLPVTPDTTACALNLSGTNGQIYLVEGTTGIAAQTNASAPWTFAAGVIDFVGFGTAAIFEGSGAAPAPSITTSITRNGSGADSDNNNADFSTTSSMTPTPKPAGPPTVTDPGAKSGVVGEAITPFTMAATGGIPPYSWSAAGLPDGVSINPSTGEVSGTPSATCTCSVTVTVTDSAGSPVTDDQVFEFTVTANAVVTPIVDIQGTSNTSPLAGNTVTTEGVVTAMYRDPAFASSSYDGMYIQTAGTGGATDTTPGASDAIFVYGANSMPAGVEVGDSVRVTGPVSEAFGTTEITPGVDEVDEISALTPVTGLQIAYPTTEADREAQEGMLLEPTDTFTVTNSYNTNTFAEVGLATGTEPLVQPTEVYRDDAPELQTVKDDNLARGVVLDDGTSLNYLTNAPAQDQPLPWLTAAGGGPNVIRVGAEATLHQPVVLENRFGTWRFQPQTPVFGNGDAVATFANTRPANETPQPVGGDLQIATFNVLNYFNTTGQAYDALPNTGCTFYNDRDGTPIGNNQCGTPAASNGNGPRGAATQESFERQQAKIVTAINTLDADIVGLEEIENSMKLLTETNRDDAVAALVAALNTAAGSPKWAYVKSPGEALATAAISEQDVIRPAFIYQPASVAPVGASDILFGTTEFANAREPLAQAFKPADAPDTEAFAVIVNHFKSKGDSTPAATGDNANSADVGAFNGDRTRQATRLAQFAQEFADARGIEAIFLAGDFNAYTHEDPMHALYDAGFVAIDSDDAADESYSFGGLSGSLDHFLGNAAADALVTGADVWEINADESIAFQYSRYNYNLTDFWQPNLPFAASDHNPEIVGIDLPAYTPDTTTKVQILGTNDFHGRLLANGQEGGAAVLSGAVKELRTQYPNTVFAAAGDLVGASTFESFIQNDEPTIDALNEAGLEVSAAGNHEFDQGYEDFVGRIQTSADWEYIAANVNEPGVRDDLAETWTQTFGDIEVGFVGAVTEDLPSLVSPAGIEGVTVSDIVDSTNAAAIDLKAAGADIVVLLVHEGSPSTDCASANFTDPTTVWGNITQNVSADVDAIVSGHTHLAYNCSFTVDDWVTENRAVTKRPVVSSGQYGTNLNQLVFSVDDATDDVVATSQDVIGLGGVGWTPDPAVVTIVNDAVTQANTLGAAKLGEIQGPFNRAKLADGTTENRGGESTLGNLVAEVQRWATETPEAGAAQIAFMNPGGLRADMAGTVNGSFRDLTYKQAAVVQPFANTLVNMDLTGAQLETVLEQQWQRTSGGTVPSRPFLRLGASDGFTYTYVETPVNVSGTSTFQGEVTGMWLNGVPIDPATSYSVTVNSFLASGGDNFFEFASGTSRADTGKVDLEAMVDYMAEFGPAGSPLPVDFSQRAVEVEFPGAAPATYAPGDPVSFDVASWTMSTADDVKDTAIQVKLGGDELGTATLNNTIGTATYDTYGTASVNVTLPESAPDGDVELTLVGQQTGTSVPVTIAVEDGVTDVQILGTNDFHGRLLQTAANREGGAAVLSGAVKQLRGENPNTVFSAAGDLVGASTFESFIQNDEPTIDALNEAGLEVSAAGNHEFDQGYEDLVGRIQASANWEYLAANVEEPVGRDDLAETWTKDFGGITVGFVGAVTEELPALVSPAGIEGVTVTDIVDATNAAAADLRTNGADLVVLLVHEGSPSTTCGSANFTDPTTVWGNITQNVSSDVDAIVSGHTHLAYNCSFPVQDWIDDNRAVTERPVVSAGQYGMNLNQLEFSVDDATNEVVGLTTALLPLMSTDPDGSGPGLPTALYPADPAVTPIVSDAVAQAEVLGAVKLGEIQAPFNRAKLANGTTENRGGESTLGNLVAEVQRWATDTPETGAAQIAFMNPGGLRADMAGTVNGDVRDLTYKQAAVVQPFANTLVNMDLTGAQIETVLEQQWQRDSGGNVPSRPFLRLGVSEGFTYTYEETVVTASPDVRTGEVTGMWLNGVAINPATSYSVTVNSFLASGGDNFREFANGAGKADTGKVDLEAMVDYLAAFAPTGDPLAVDYSQRAVEVKNVANEYVVGGDLTFDVASWTMSNATDVKDSEIVVKLGDTVLGTAALDNTIGTAVYDAYGTAPVDMPIPGSTPAGPATLTLVGESTGTEVIVPITLVKADSTVTGEDVSQVYGLGSSMHVSVSADGVVPSGRVTLRVGEVGLGQALLSGGEADVPIAARRVGPGIHEVTISYLGDGSVKPSTSTATLTVTKATPTVVGTRTVMEYGTSSLMPVRVGAAGVVPTGLVTLRANGVALGTGTLTDGLTAATIAAKRVPPGTYQVTITYQGDEFVKSGTGTATLVVQKATPTVIGVNTSMTFGQNGAMTVKVKATGLVPTGTVSLTANGVSLGPVATLVDGQVVATLVRNRLPASASPYTVTIKYSGDGFVKAGTGTASLTVRP